MDFEFLAVRFLKTKKERKGYMSVAVVGSVGEHIDAQIEKYQTLLQILQKQRELENEKSHLMVNGSSSNGHSVPRRGRPKGSVSSHSSSSSSENEHSCDDSIWILLDKKPYKKSGLSFTDIAGKLGKEVGWKPKKGTKKPEMTLRQSIFRLMKDGFVTKEKTDEETTARYVLTNKERKVVGYNAKAPEEE